MKRYKYTGSGDTNLDFIDILDDGSVIAQLKSGERKPTIMQDEMRHAIPKMLSIYTEINILTF